MAELRQTCMLLVSECAEDYDEIMFDATRSHGGAGFVSVSSLRGDAACSVRKAVTVCG